MLCSALLYCALLYSTRRNSARLDSSTRGSPLRYATPLCLTLNDYSARLGSYMLYSALLYVTLLSAKRLYSYLLLLTLLYYTLLNSDRLGSTRSARFGSALRCSALRWYALPCSALRYPTLLCDALRYHALLESTLL